MKRIRITLARLMIVVAVVGVDLAALILAWRHQDIELIAGLAPTGFVCQVGLLFAVLRSGRWRAFWAGFVIFGCAMMATFAWGMYFTESAACDAWVWYMERGMELSAGLPDSPFWSAVGGDREFAVILSLPQLAVACAGGLVFFLVAQVMRRFVRARACDAGQGKSLHMDLGTAREDRVDIPGGVPPRGETQQCAR
jgi:hypothetical protein